jgi:hypothetical protein
MPTTTATLVYKAVAQGGSVAAISAAMAAVPLPQDILTKLGVRVQSDVTAGLTRTIVLALVPIVNATATAALVPGNNGSGSPIVSLTFVGEGDGYAAPPDISITDTAKNGGFGARAIVKLDVFSIGLTAPGAGYATAPIVTFVGGQLAPGGVPATAHATVLAGAVNTLALDTLGSGYNGIPNLLFTGGGGSGAAGSVLMETAGLVLLGGGSGYKSPVVTFVPHFKSLFPDTGDQRAPFWNLIKTNMQRQLCCPIFAAPPVIA